MSYRDISPARLRELLDYDPDTGRFTWKFRAGNDRHTKAWDARYAGQEAFTCIDSYGYATGSIYGIYIKAHRVAWAWWYGEWPKDQIDHRNGDRAANWIKNLKPATQIQNSRNMKALPRLVADLPPGVKRSPKLVQRPYQARIGVSGKRIHLGYFATPNEAHQAYLAACRKHGFSLRHGT